MQDFFEDYDEYCVCVNNARLLTEDEAELASHEEDDRAAWEADSDYAYEKRQDRLTWE